MKKKRTYNPNLIKETLNYSVNDMADLFKIHKRTPQQWFKEGLPKIDDRKPFLTLGIDLKEFIKNKRSKRRSKCRPDELYCCKCRMPQKSWNNLVDLRILNERRLLIVGVCSQCNSRINRLAFITNFVKIQEIFAVQTIHNKDLMGSDHSIVNTDI